MDKNAIKKYAVWARRELISRVSQKAAQYEITADGYGDRDADSVNGRMLSQSEKEQRAALVDQIKTKGYEQVMEEAAYTWFNRFSALRFMEVNGYLPSYVRVFTDDENNFKPQILTEAINLELDGLDVQKVYDLKNANDNDELFKYLLITQCNALSSILPGMFQKIDDFTELLFPDNLLRDGSVIEQMVTLIPEDNWTDQVQIIGWLYEAYNTERNELVYDGSFRKLRLPKELLPAATTIFTPDWPIRYMVENSLGRLWVEGHPSEKFKTRWKYYLDDEDQETYANEKLTIIRQNYSSLKPEEILAIDPCQGSGHILAYMFDVLIQIYEAYGYSAREAAALIVEHNLWGLDIDDRASQLAYFSVMMKARQYDARFFKRGIQPHVYSIVESNNVDPHCVNYYVNGRPELKAAMDSIIAELYDAKEYGSIINVTPVDFDAMYARFDEIENDISIYRDQTLESLIPLVQVAQALAQKYHIVITNPPYLGNSRFSSKLDKFIKQNYKDEKADLSMVMYKRALCTLCDNSGFVAFITTSSWMYLPSFEKMRELLTKTASICSLVDFGTELFEGKVGHNPIVAWVTRKSQIDTTFQAVRLVDYCYSRRNEKEFEFFNNDNRYVAKQKNFTKIPGTPIAYWVSNAFINTFDNSTIEHYFIAIVKGIFTGDNNRFLRLWQEVQPSKLGNNGSAKKWMPYSKGGDFRRWYGNLSYVVNWENNAAELRNYEGSGLGPSQYFGRETIVWTKLTSYKTGFRSNPGYVYFDDASPALVSSGDNDLYILAFLNSSVCDKMLELISPTLNYQCGEIKKLPIITSLEHKDEIIKLAEENVSLAKSDWDSFESSWNFKKHPLIRNCTRVEEAFNEWQRESSERFEHLKRNEERINALFAEIYGLLGETIIAVDEKDVSVRKADLSRDIKSLLSYLVGCIFGRFSLYEDGILSDDKQSNWDDYVDKDGIIPFCDDEYFDDDIVGLIIKMIEKVYGIESLEENLLFITTSLGYNNLPPRIALRDYFMNQFYDDHCSMCSVAASGKRPFYWLFDSGKKNGFKCLIYIHRYRPDTIARIRTDYVHEQQSRYRTAIADLENRISTAGTSERVKLTKQLNRIQDQAEELRIYEEKIHHLADQMISIDLDDGVKKNYAIFQDVLAKIK